jgi:hypothetical protein
MGNSSLITICSRVELCGEGFTCTYWRRIDNEKMRTKYDNFQQCIFLYRYIVLIDANNSQRGETFPIQKSAIYSKDRKVLSIFVLR